MIVHIASIRRKLYTGLYTELYAKLYTALVLACAASLVTVLGCSSATSARQAKTDTLVKTSWNTKTTLPFVQEVVGTVFIFARDGTYQQVSPDGNIAALGKWSLASGEASIDLTLSNGLKLSLDIQELTSESFRFRLKLPDSGAIVEFFCSPVR